ncbi:hypothetical protein CROQUDRAFT_25089, partial [Cronartium quercuum f. sp. fusiforme G11]
EEWFKNPKVVNSWKNASFNPEDKPILIAFGEAVQIWSPKRSEVIEDWSPGFIPLWIGERSGVTISKNQLTSSVPFRMVELYKSIAKLTPKETMDKMKDWYSKLLGDEETDDRFHSTKDQAFATEKKIVEKLVRFSEYHISTSLNPNDVDHDHNSFRLYLNINVAYPKIYEHYCQKMISKYGFEVFKALKTKTLDPYNERESTRDYFENLFHMQSKWPVWSYKQAVDILRSTSHPDFRSNWYQEILQHPSYLVRLSRIESTPNQIANFLPPLIQKFNNGKESQIDFLQSQWLLEMVVRLPNELQEQIEENCLFISNGPEKEFRKVVVRATQKGRKVIKREMEKIFLAQEQFTPSEALCALLTLEHMRGSPITFKRERNTVRSSLWKEPRYDFDQKLDWLQHQAKSLMIKLIVASYKNFLASIEDVSFSSRTALNQHLLVENFKQMYRLNPKIWKASNLAVIEIVGIGNFLRAERAIQSGLRQIWAQDIWAMFIDGKLGYKKEDSIYHEIYAFGNALRLTEEYPTFLGTNLETSRVVLFSTTIVVRDSLRSILKEEYQERLELVLMLSDKKIQHLMRQVNVGTWDELVPKETLLHWLHHGISAPTMLKLVLYLCFHTDSHPMGGNLNGPNKLILQRALGFLQSPLWKESPEYQGLSSIFKK